MKASSAKVDQPPPRPALIAVALTWLVTVALVAVEGFLIFGVNWRGVPGDFQPSSSSIAGLVPILAMSTVGALIAARHPANRIGWLLMTVSISASFLDFPRLYAGLAIYGHARLPAAEWLYWLSQIAWILVFVELLVLLPLWFPDGRLLSRRWAMVIGLATLPVAMVAAASLDPAALAPLQNPVGVRALAGLGNALNGAPFTILMLGTYGLGVSSLVVRYRRGGEQERQQLKWLVGGIVVLLATLVASFLIPALQNTPIIALAAAFLPIAIGIGVLRYRLYDIDLIINKALVYGGLAAVITAVYVLVVINIGALVGGGQRLWLSLLTTAGLALAFQPLRDRAQRLANRLVYGKRATPYEALSQFSEHLSETFSDEDILDRMVRILAQGTGAERAEIWVRAGHQLVLASTSPQAPIASMPLAMQDGALPELQRDTVVPVSHGGELLGALAVDKKRGETMNTVEQKLVADLAGQAGLVLKNVGLNRELLARLEDLRTSRQRLVTAQDEERRRIERDLHDGAQQHLVALKIKVGLAESLAEPESKTRPILAQLKRDADEAIDNLRELARGIYPPLLASDGLGAALQAPAQRFVVPVELDVQVPRQPRGVESAIYFCCLEAMQNVAKYAEASHVNLRIWMQDSTLAFSVADNGKGFEPSTVVRSSGLQNMRDRLEALGGSLEVTSAPGGGATIAGQVPVGLASP
jgi:signal transduction histidine kinase